MSDGPQEQPSGARGRWLIAAVTAVVLVAAGVGGVVALGGDDAEDDGPVGGSTTDATPGPDQPADPITATHTLDGDLCDQIELSAVDDLYDAPGAVDPLEGTMVAEQELYCTVESLDSGLHSVRSMSHDSTEQAETTYQRLRDSELPDGEAVSAQIEQVDGEWDVAEAVVASHGGTLVARANDLVTVATVYPPEGEDVDTAAAQEAAASMAESLITAARD
ncbi:hypothetical protein [Aeromicrobium sp. CTD01-1L150]|uniref:hypothetical protein n=1 Tax=Aeromicrobium sp. CTD01-1L150 TaxID=3341830 RepID=UPI0035BEE6D4